MQDDNERVTKAAAELYNFRIAQQIAEQAKGQESEKHYIETMTTDTGEVWDTTRPVAKTIDSGPVNCTVKLTSIATTAEVVPDINDRVTALEAWKEETAEALNLDLEVGYGLVEDWLKSKNRLAALEERVEQVESDKADKSLVAEVVANGVTAGLDKFWAMTRPAYRWSNFVFGFLTGLLAGLISQALRYLSS